MTDVTTNWRIVPAASFSPRRMSSSEYLGAVKRCLLAGCRGVRCGRLSARWAADTYVLRTSCLIGRGGVEGEGDSVAVGCCGRDCRVVSVQRRCDFAQHFRDFSLVQVSRRVPPGFIVGPPPPTGSTAAQLHPKPYWRLCNTRAGNILPVILSST